MNCEMHAEFKDVRGDVAGLRAEMRAEFKDVRGNVAGLRAEMKAEGETTRRHFDVMAELLKDIVKVVAEGTVRNTERLDDHENRITAIEKPAR